MLLAMFHVSYPSRNYKNWLYAVLRWLFNHESNTIDALGYIGFLENLSDGYFFGYYANPNKKSDDFLNLIFDLDFNSPYPKTEIDPEILNIGTHVPNFIFNRLDYLLWKKEMGNYKNFRFTFRSSVEHYYPQNPFAEKPFKNLNHFGNLCLISSSRNSVLNNRSIEEKKKYLADKTIESIKQSIMLSFEYWGETEIQEHGNKMIDILNAK